MLPNILPVLFMVGDSVTIFVHALFGGAPWTLALVALLLSFTCNIGRSQLTFGDFFGGQGATACGAHCWLLLKVWHVFWCPWLQS
jgi:hypothetical protein